MRCVSLKRNLGRYFRGQDRMYDTALQELKAGKKEHHWMWYIFPQMLGLGQGRTAFIYGIENMEEAGAYLAHPILGPRLIECCEALLRHTDKTAEDILGEIDAVKLCSSMTLFALVSEDGSVFHRVLKQFFDGRQDPLTLGLAEGNIIDITHRKYLASVWI